MVSKNLKFRRQFLLTTKSLTTLNNWNEQRLGVHKLYTHPDLTKFFKSNKTIEVVLLGHILDPKNHNLTESDILGEIVENPTPEGIADILYGLSGRFVLIVKSKDRLLFFNDACGLRSFFYAQYQYELQIASQPLLLQLVTGDMISKKERYDSFFDSDYGKNSKENWFPSGTSLYQNVYHLVPNHYLDSFTLKQTRYWPVKQHEINSYNTSLEKFSTLLQNILVGGSKKYKLALGVTAGFDSRIILSTCKPVKDKMLFYTLKYRNMTNKSRDIKIPTKLNKVMHFDHKVMDCQIPTNQNFAEIYESNSDMAHLDDWGFIAYGISKNLPEGTMAIKGSCSETGRCYFYKSGKHPELNSGFDLLKYNPKWKGISFIENQLNNWYDEISNPKINLGYPILDLFHWEVSTGSWQTQNQLEWDIVHETYTPFNNRELLDIMLTIDTKFRSKQNDYQIYRDTINKFWPEALTQPVNPPTTEEWVKNIIKGLLTKIGVKKYEN